MMMRIYVAIIATESNLTDLLDVGSDVKIIFNGNTINVI